MAQRNAPLTPTNFKIIRFLENDVDRAYNILYYVLKAWLKTVIFSCQKVPSTDGLQASTPRQHLVSSQEKIDAINPEEKSDRLKKCKDKLEALKNSLKNALTTSQKGKR